METIKCIFCKKNGDQIVIEENGYQARRCPQCGLIFVSPRPSAAEIERLYSDDMAQMSAGTHIVWGFLKRLYARHNLRIIKKYMKNGSMLEIGAGAGYFSHEAKKQGFDVSAIELNTILADFIRNKFRIPCEDSPLNRSSFGNKKFDVIYHCDVVGHLHDPISEFEKINAKLKENGILVFETGNFSDVNKKYYGLITKFQLPDHLFFFGESNLKELLRQTGFEVINIYKYSIVLQLAVDKTLKKLMASAISGKTTKETGKNDIAAVIYSDIGGSRFKRLIRGAYSSAIYFIRYQIGSILPKKQQPQTIIVVARKRNNCVS